MQQNRAFSHQAPSNVLPNVRCRRESFCVLLFHAGRDILLYDGWYSRLAVLLYFWGLWCTELFLAFNDIACLKNIYIINYKIERMGQRSCGFMKRKRDFCLIFFFNMYILAKYSQWFLISQKILDLVLNLLKFLVLPLLYWRFSIKFLWFFFLKNC